MDFLRPSRRRTVLSEAAYVFLNVSVAIAVFAVVYFVGSPLAAFAVVILSKWRVFAVRPQYWFAHLVANMVDIIVGLSFVVFLAAAGGSLVVQLLLTTLYAGWLLFLKPRSKRPYVTLQAAAALFLGTAAIAQISYDWWSSAVVLGLWIVGYASARHTLSGYREPHTMILSLIWGLVVAEIGWMTYYWTTAYDVPFSGQLQIAQVALIVTLLGFLVERTYASYHHHKEIRLSDVLLPLLFSVSSILLLVTVFGSVQSI